MNTLELMKARKDELFAEKEARKAKAKAYEDRRMALWEEVHELKRQIEEATAAKREALNSSVKGVNLDWAMLNKEITMLNRVTRGKSLSAEPIKKQ